MPGRIRSVKPEWLEDERMSTASDEARVLSVALILLADDYGRGRGSEHYMFAQVWGGLANPREGLARVSRAMRELVAMRFVEVYEVDAQRYYQIRTWGRHQKVDHPGKPRVPAPLENPRESSRDSRETLAKVPETLAPDPIRSDPIRSRSDPISDSLEPAEDGPAAKPTSPPIQGFEFPVTFPVTGSKNGPWLLTEDQYEEWRALYPNLDVMAEIRKAKAWILSMPRKRKTAAGMPRFLVGWLNRTTDSARPKSQEAPSPPPSIYPDLTHD
jgi:hypothetical protein